MNASLPASSSPLPRCHQPARRVGAVDRLGHAANVKCPTQQIQVNAVIWHPSDVLCALGKVNNPPFRCRTVRGSNDTTKRRLMNNRRISPSFPLHFIPLHVVYHPAHHHHHYCGIAANRSKQTHYDARRQTATR